MDAVCRDSQIVNSGRHRLNMRLHALPHADELQEFSTMPTDCFSERVITRQAFNLGTPTKGINPAVSEVDDERTKIMIKEDGRECRSSFSTGEFEDLIVRIRNSSVRPSLKIMTTIQCQSVEEARESQ